MKTHKIKIHKFKEVGGTQIIKVPGYNTKEEAIESLGPQNRHWMHLEAEEIEYDLSEISEAIAEKLEGDWVCSPSNLEINSAFAFRRSDGLGFWMRKGGYQLQNRIKFRYSIPRDSERLTVCVKKHTPSITCNDRKTAEQLVKDIERRLLPDCEEVHKLYMEALKEREEYYKEENKTKEGFDKIKPVDGLYFSQSGVSIQVSGCWDINEAIRASELLQGL